MAHIERHYFISIQIANLYAGMMNEAKAENMEVYLSYVFHEKRAMSVFGVYMGRYLLVLEDRFILQFPSLTNSILNL